MPVSRQIKIGFPSARSLVIAGGTLLLLAFAAHSVGGGTSGAAKGQTAPRGPQSSLNSMARRYATDFNWSTTPPDDLGTTGAKTIHLAACPNGVTGREPWYYVYIAGTGTPEAAKVTGGTCKGDNQAGTLQLTTQNQHSAGYTVESASTGLQEASIAARYPSLNPSSRAVAGGSVILAPVEFDIHARVSIRATSQTVDFSGSTFNCYTDDACIFVGDPGNSNMFSDITLINPKGQPMVANGTKPMIETNGGKTRIFNVSARQNPSRGTFGTYVQVDDDQAFLLDGLDSAVASVIRCDAAFCGSDVTAPGPFNRASAVGWLKHLQLSNQCDGNGVDWQSGNTLHIEDSVIQGFSQFGVRTGTMRGGYGPSELTNVYMEVGGCTNPQYPGKGIAARAVAGLISEGVVMIEGPGAPVGQVPEFSSQGSANVYYWIVVKDSKMGSSVPLPIGYAKSNGKTPVPVAWPHVKGTNTITYDLLKTADSGSPWPVPSGSGAFAVATNIVQCSGPVCTAVDSNAAPASYAVSPAGYYPEISFWPGGIILSPNADRSNPSGSAALFADGTDFVTNVSPLVNVLGVSAPTVYANHCAARALPNTWVSCLAGDSVGNNAVPSATVLQYGTVNGGDPENRKGRLIFGRTPFSSLNRGHYITLVDSNPTKTMNARGYRPPTDGADTYIGLDNPNTQLNKAQLAFGAPVSISGYIANEGDGQHWGERLTAREKTFAVPVVIQQGSSLTVGGGSALSQMKMYKTPAIPPTKIPAQRCLDVSASVTGLNPADQITGITPPPDLGNLSVNAYAKSANTLILHFCNPSPAVVTTPAGTYSFLAVH